MSWTPATSSTRAANSPGMHGLGEHRELTGLPRSPREGCDLVAKDLSGRLGFLSSSRSSPLSPFFRTFAQCLCADRGLAGVHFRKRKAASSAQFWCNLSPLDATPQPRLPSSVRSSKFRIPQLLYLPLLPKHRGCGDILPILELISRRHYQSISRWRRPFRRKLIHALSGQNPAQL